MVICETLHWYVMEQDVNHAMAIPPDGQQSARYSRRYQAAIWLILALAGFVVGQIISTIMVVVVAAALGKAGSVGSLIASPVPPAWIIVTELVGIWIGFVGAVLIASRYFGTRRIRNDMGLSFKSIDLVIGIVTGLVSQIIMIPILYIPLRAIYPDLSHKLSGPAHELTGGFHGYDLAIIGALIVIVVPVVEEMFFRGLLLSSLIALFERTGKRVGPALAVITGGICFGLAHFEPLQLLGLAAFGIVLCIIAYKVRRIGPTIVAHATFNLVAIVAIAVTASQVK